MPLQVVEGFFESDRGRSDSGVWGIYGIGKLMERENTKILL